MMDGWNGDEPEIEAELYSLNEVCAEERAYYEYKENAER